MPDTVQPELSSSSRPNSSKYGPGLTRSVSSRTAWGLSQGLRRRFINQLLWPSRRTVTCDMWRSSSLREATTENSKDFPALDKPRPIGDRNTHILGRTNLTIQRRYIVTMCAAVRQFLAFYMCCVLAAGNLPALLHVASHSRVSSHAEPVGPHDSCHSCCCEAQHASESEDGESNQPEHDHQDCPICQSLFTVFTKPDLSRDLLSVLLRSYTLCAEPPCSILCSDLLIPDSRGPPSRSFASL